MPMLISIGIVLICAGLLILRLPSRTPAAEQS
jgi:hypothetical protein